MRRVQVLRLVVVVLIAQIFGAVLLCNLRRGAPAGKALALWSARTPSAVYTPLQVVRFQLEAMQAYRGEGTRTEQLAALDGVFRFASPANRRATGPLPRFAAMLERGSYAPMLGASQVEARTVGVCKGRFARVDAVVTSAAGDELAYTFYLSRTRVGDAEAAWVTDGVIREEPAPKSPREGWL